MRALAWLLILDLGLVLAADGPGGRPCTLSVDATSSKARGVKPGQTFSLKIKWTNHGAAGFAEGVLQLQLPPHASFKRASGPLGGGRGAKPVYDASTRTVTWARLSTRAKSRSGFTVRVKAAKCYGDPQLVFKATAFVLDPNAAEPTPLCTQEDFVVVVRGYDSCFGPVYVYVYPSSEYEIPPPPANAQPVKRGRRTPQCAPTISPTMHPTFEGETYSPSRQPTPAPVRDDGAHRPAHIS